MERNVGPEHFFSTEVESVEEGMIGQELKSGNGEKSELVARLVFWDAEGQFEIETMRELPLVILEEFIKETKEKIKLK